MKQETVYCEINKIEITKKDARQGFTIRPSIFKLIQEKSPHFNNDSWISNEDLKAFKLEYIQKLVEDEEGDKENIKRFVAQAVANHDFLSTNYLNTIDDDSVPRSTKELIADKIAEFGGSWNFIFFFFGFVFLWCCLNTFVFVTKSFDPYPYIFLNLVLGCIASIQAPIIMMSQNRASEIDRRRALNDFKVNLKNEFELNILREKIDHIINKQNPHIHETLDEHFAMLEEMKDMLSDIKKLENV